MLATRSPLTSQTNAGGKPLAAKPAGASYAQGGAMSVVRNRSSTTTLAPSSTLTTPAVRPRAGVDSTPLSRSTGGAVRNSPMDASPDDEPPTSPSGPTTNNPRSNIAGPGRELFPQTSLFNSTQPSVARSSTWARGSAGGFAGSAFGGLGGSGGLAALPTTNMSLDSATFGSLLHNRDSKFLIPPFHAQPRLPPSVTPDVFNVAQGLEDSVVVATPTSSSNASKAAPLHHVQPGYYTVVFDLDETLCSNRGPGKAILRPGCLDILKSLRAISTPERPVEVILWTASVESLARTVLPRLDPDGSIFTDLIFRDKRWFKETGYTKDLRLLGRDMERVVIIENSPMSVTLNRQQAILVKDFMGHAPHDTDLKAVKEILEGWITAEPFVPIREWLATHPRMDRNNHVIAAPSLNAIVGARNGSLGGATALPAGPAVKRAFAPRSTVPLYGRRW